VNIRIIDQESRTLVRMVVPVLREVPPSPALFEYVATEGQNYYFGGLHYVPGIEGGMLLFKETLLGDYLDEEELMNAVVAVVGTANRIDNDFVARFGGETFHDT